MMTNEKLDSALHYLHAKFDGTGTIQEEMLMKLEHLKCIVLEFETLQKKYSNTLSDGSRKKRGTNKWQLRLQKQCRIVLSEQVAVLDAL